MIVSSSVCPADKMIFFFMWLKEFSTGICYIFLVNGYLSDSINLAVMNIVAVDMDVYVTLLCAVLIPLVFT